MLQTAIAVREVMDFVEMDTMCAEPVGVRCVSFAASGEGGGLVVE